MLDRYYMDLDDYQYHVVGIVEMFDNVAVVGIWEHDIGNY